MRRLFISSVALLAFALLALLSPLMSAAAPAADEQAIKDRLEEFRSAWNKDDTTAMAAVFAEDGSLINPFGTVAQGRDAIKKVFVEEHAGLFKASKYEASDVKTQSVTPDVAIVDATGNISGVHKPDGSAAPDYKHHVTWVFVKKDRKWMAAAARPYQFDTMPK